MNDNLHDGPLGELALRASWPLWAMALLMVVAVLYAGHVYGKDMGISAVLRFLLRALRAVVYLLLIALLFEPVLTVSRDILVPSNLLVLLDVSESMAIQDERRREEDLLQAARALAKAPFPGAPPQPGTPGGMSPAVREPASSPSRLELARGILSNPELEVFRGDDGTVRVRFFRFGERLEPLEDEGEALKRSLLEAEATATTTRLGSALAEAVERYSGQTIDGVVVLTDGAWNSGTDALEVGRSLGRKSIPVFPIGLGLERPDDVRIQAAIVQDTVFAKDRVPVKVHLVSRGYDGESAILTVSLDGSEVARKDVALSDGSQFHELSFVPQGTAGSRTLTVSISPLAQETTTENNSAERPLRVIDERIKVLYVEGKPRWEYRYLRAVLLRDPRLDVRLLLTEGDPELPEVSPGYIGRFPDRAEDTARFDLVIVGDVPAYYFTRSQLEWIEKLVRESGGSFLLLAGQDYAPMTYRGTPIASLLPVEMAAAGSRDLHSAVHPVITEVGFESQMMLLGTSRRRSALSWQLVRPLFRVPLLRGAKPGARVLLTLSDSEISGGSREDDLYPLVAWHRYGTGKVLFVGTDQLWRLRYRQGDRHHASFWGQAIRFLTLSRLLGENKRIRIEADRKQYRAGERIGIYVNALNESFDPLSEPAYTVSVNAAHMTDPARMELQAVPGSAGLYQGYYMPEREGTYEIEADPADRGDANSVTLSVAPFEREMLDPEMHKEELRQLAKASGGDFVEIADLPQLSVRLKPRPRTMQIRHERELWDHWSLFVIILALASLEWFLRRRYDLA